MTRRRAAILFVAVLVLSSFVIAVQPWSGPVDLSDGAAGSETAGSDVVTIPMSASHDSVPTVDLTQVVRIDGELPDPSVLAVDGGYVAVGTNIVANGLLLNAPVRRSTDLRTWSEPVDAMPRLPAWAEAGRTWAPTLVHQDGGYELWFSAVDRESGRQCIGVARSESATGPYTSDDSAPVVCAPTLGGAIDPEVVVLDGTRYLLWKNDGNCCTRTVRIWAQELAGTDLLGDAVALLWADASWELGIVENPAVVRVDGAIVLLYSGGQWSSDSYGIGYAVCIDLRIACEKRSRRGPAIVDAEGTWGSGGASTFAAADGSTWMAWHAWVDGAAGRSMLLAPVGTS